jgi:uncharacterized protein (DUF2147 family)
MEVFAILAQLIATAKPTIDLSRDALARLFFCQRRHTASTPRWREAVALSALLLLAPSVLRAQGTSPDNPVGIWLTQDGHGVVRISPCATGLCGAIVGIDQAPGDATPKDVSGRPQCGLSILTGSANSQGGVVEGLITDPRNGKAYHARLWVGPEGKLHVRGYLGIPLLGQTQVWRAFSGQITDGCRFAQSLS